MTTTTPSTMAGRRAVLYLRVSTERQADSGHGLDAQRAALDTYTADRGLHVVEVVTDGGESGSSVDRPGLARVLALVDAGAVDVVLAAKGDRVARSLRDFLNLTAYLQARGVSLALAEEAFDTSSPAGELMVQVRGAVAQYELALIRQRTREGLAAARAKGVRLGRPPVGWTIVSGVWEPTHRHEVVKRAHELRAAGLRYDDIAAQLRADGIPTGSGRGSWSKGQVCRLLKSPLTPPDARRACAVAA